MIYLDTQKTAGSVFGMVGAHQTGTTPRTWLDRIRAAMQRAQTLKKSDGITRWTPRERPHEQRPAPVRVQAFRGLRRTELSDDLSGWAESFGQIIGNVGGVLATSEVEKLKARLAADAIQRQIDTANRQATAQNIQAIENQRILEAQQRALGMDRSTGTFTTGAPSLGISTGTALALGAGALAVVYFMTKKK